MTSDQVQAEHLQDALGKQYLIERELGRGGMGVVYLARDVTLDRLVAVKVVHPDLTTNRTVASRFLAEARTIARLRHPNIVAVHTAGEVDGQLYYVMDYLSGETLRQRLARAGRLEVGTAVRIAAEIAGALDIAARAGIVHRDLKPENVLLEGPPEQPSPLLADFGIARLVESGGEHTGPGAVMGTPAYMSPEQAAGEEVDGRSDLYSLGVLTYEMLAGAPPFAGPNRVVISKQILDPPTPIESIRPDLPAPVAAAVTRALAKTPADRWQDGASLRLALLGEIPTPPSPVPAARRRSRTRRLAVGAALVLLGVAGAVFARRPGGPPEGVDPRHSILVLPFDNLREESSLEWLREGSVNMLSLALSQWRDLTVVDQERVHDLLITANHDDGQPIGLDLARRLARKSGAWTVVLGDFSRAGDSLHLVARTYDVATGRRLEVIPVGGPTDEDARPLFDDLAARLLDVSGAPLDGRATLASVTTASLEAYQAYLQGIEALNHWRLNEASRAFERAVATDSTFSLAYYKLAVTRGWISPEDTLGSLAIRRAARTSERLPERERRLIDAYRTFLDGRYDESLSLYHALVARDSGDVDAWYGLADASFHGGYARSAISWLSQSLRAFRTVVAIDSGYALAYEHMGQLLTDAGSRSSGFMLVGRDSLVGVVADSAVRGRARRLAQAQAVESAEGWIRNQPGTPRAHYHLYKALLASGRVVEARQVVGDLRSMYPDTVQPVFGFFDARAQLVGGDMGGAARAVRQALPAVRPEAVARIDYASETQLELMTGATALAYLGDLSGALAVIRLTHDVELALQRAVDSVGRVAMADNLELGRQAQLLSATGAAPARLRAIWSRGFALARRADASERTHFTASLTPAALGVFLGPDSDSTPLLKLRELTGRPWPNPVSALVAVRRGDTVAARAALAAQDPPPGTATSVKDRREGWGDLRPIAAEAHFELGEYAKVIDILRDFDAENFATRGFDPRWALLPRMHLLRGAAYEQLGQRPLAVAEYRAVVDQWSSADAELLPVVQEARAGLARLQAPQLSATASPARTIAPHVAIRRQG